MIVINEMSSYQTDLKDDQSGFHQDQNTFVSALHEKYVDQEEFDNDFKLPKDASISTEITFVGFHEVTSIQRQLKRLASIDLSNRGIKDAGNVSSISGCLHRVLTLNLANNYLTWKEVVNILPFLPNLKEIILTNNKLADGEDIELKGNVLKSLDSIVLGQIHLDWSHVTAILSKIWSHVYHIDLWKSHLTNESMVLEEASESHPFMTQIRSISLSENHLTSLDWISKAGRLTNLTELDVSRCGMITLGMNDVIARQLKGVKVLNISYNDIASWKEIAQLDLLDNLVILICNDNPFFITDKFARSQTTARIASLRTLNRETITSAFRRDSEIMYLRRVYPEYEASGEGRNDDFRSMHPRFQSLIKLYGVPEGLSSGPRTIGDKYITIDLCHRDKTITKKVPRDMRVSNLKMLCKGLFKLRSIHGLEIVCCIDKSQPKRLSYPLDQDGQTLHFFSVDDHQRLVIKSSD